MRVRSVAGERLLERRFDVEGETHVGGRELEAFAPHHDLELAGCELLGELGDGAARDASLEPREIEPRQADAAIRDRVGQRQ